MAHKGTWTASFGGNGGTEFEIYNDNYSFSGLKGRSGDWIDRISLDFDDGDLGELITSQEYGGLGGTEFSWPLPKKGVQSIIVWAVPTQYVHGIQFFLANGEFSPLFGQATGQRYEIDVSYGQIAGFAGRVGTYLDQIKFYVVPQDRSFK